MGACNAHDCFEVWLYQEKANAHDCVEGWQYQEETNAHGCVKDWLCHSLEQLMHMAVLKTGCTWEKLEMSRTMLKMLSGAQDPKKMRLTSTSMKLVRLRRLIWRARLETGGLLG
jgi:hypothetical protein